MGVYKNGTKGWWWRTGSLDSSPTFPVENPPYLAGLSIQDSGMKELVWGFNCLFQAEWMKEGLGTQLSPSEWIVSQHSCSNHREELSMLTHGPEETRWSNSSPHRWAKTGQTSTGQRSLPWPFPTEVGSLLSLLEVSTWSSEHKSHSPIQSRATATVISTRDVNIPSHSKACTKNALRHFQHILASKCEPSLEHIHSSHSK